MSSQMQAIAHGAVDLLQWNPRVPLPIRPRRAFRWTRNLPFAPRINNFGDLLGPAVVSYLAQQHGLPARRQSQRRALASIGSVIHMIPNGCTVWGSGVNGKSLTLPVPSSLDVRAVRGPLTRDYLAKQGVHVPDVFGDPGLLAPMLFGDDPVEIQNDLTIIWNLNDAPRMPTHPDRISPNASLEFVVDRIRRSRFVTGSSLHGLILADAFGIPSRPIMSEHEPDFKYRDYYLGTGRSNIQFARNTEEALSLGPVEPLNWSSERLLGAFPSDLFSVARQLP